MKKRAKSKSPSAPIHIEPDMTELIGKLQLQLAVIEKKIDVLISKSAAIPRPPDSRPNQSIGQKPFQRPDQGQRNGEVKQENRFRERVLHKAICADCHKPCEVPFQPRPDRPVYCKDCFSKRKSPNTFNVRPDNRPKMVTAAPVIHAEKEPAVEKIKPVEKKKKPAAKRKKKSA